MEKQNCSNIIGQSQKVSLPEVQKTFSADFILSKIDSHFKPLQEMDVVKAVGNVFPIAWFGNLKEYFQSKVRVVTVGLNP